MLFGSVEFQDAVRISERLRPSLEQVAAQKGAKRLEMLLSSALRGCKFRAVCVVNMTGYVEELAQTVTCWPLSQDSFL